MIAIQRWLVSGSALLFGLYHAYLGLTMMLGNHYHDRPLVVTALILYSLALIASVTLYERMRLPWDQASANFGVVILVPWLVQIQLTEDQKGGYVTWYVAAAATLLAVTAVRQHKILAWVGLATLIAQVLIWGGAGFFVNSGLIGAISFVVAGTAISIGLESTATATAAFTEEAKATAAASASTSAARLERQARAQEALRGALPTLRNIVAKGGELNQEEKFEATLLEAKLRDEIGGGLIVDALILDAALEARRRDVEVSIRDEGGLDTAEFVELEAIRFEVVKALNRTQTGRVIVRAPKGEKWRLTVVVSQPGSDEPDEFLKLGAA